MKRTVVCLCALGVVSGLSIGVESSRGSDGAGTLDIQITVSPHTIVLGTDKGAMVTVHTDIALGAVNRSSVELNGVPARLTKADNRGNLVAKFDQAAIEAIIAPPKATLVLTGVTKDDTPFSGSDTVRVIVDPSPEEQD